MAGKYCIHGDNYRWGIGADERKFYVVADPKASGGVAGYRVCFDENGARRNFSYFSVNKSVHWSVALHLANQLRDDMNDRELK